MPRKIDTFATCVSLLVLDIISTLFFILNVLPLIYPLIFVRGDYWLLWPTAGVFGGLWGLLIVYVVQRAINYEYKEWNQAFLLAAVFFISGAGLAYVFDKVFPLDFEPFRSLVLPAMVFTIAFVIIARFKPKRASSSS